MISQFVPRKRLWLAYSSFGLIFAGQIAALWLEWFRILVFSFLGATCVLLLYRSGPDKLRDGARLLILSFAAVWVYIALSIFWSTNPSGFIVDVVYVFAPIVPALVFGYVAGRRLRLNEIASALALVPFVFGAQMIVSKLNFGDPMLIASLSMRSILAMLICLSFPVIVSCYLSSGKKAALFASVICFLILVLSESRSLGIIAIPSVLYLLYQYKRKLFWLFVALLIVAAPLFAVGSSDGLFSRFTAAHTSLDITENVEIEFSMPVEERVDFERRLAAYVSKDIFVDNPFFGGGYLSTYQKIQNEYSMELVAHGFVPGMLGELGLIGFFVIVFFVVCALRRLNYLSDSSNLSQLVVVRGFVVGFGAMLVFGFFHQIFESPYFAMFVGILAGTGWGFSDYNMGNANFSFRRMAS